MSNNQINQFESRDELAETLAEKIAATLSQAIAESGSAMLAVSGGSTPKLLFQQLAVQKLDWERVYVTLVDERWVGEDDERSNALLVRENLLTENASLANFVPLYREGDIDDQLPRVEKDLDSLPFPFDAVILGMGADGHTASFFPGGDNLAQAVDPQNTRRLCSMRAEGAVEPRVTFTLPVLIKSTFLALHIEGDEKMTVFEQAIATGDADLLPVRHVIRARERLEIFWAP